MNSPFVDETHEQSLQSWVTSANDASTEFPIQNLPFGLIEVDGKPVCGVAIGNSILNLAAVIDMPWFAELNAATRAACKQASLNDMMSLPSSDARALRKKISSLLSSKQSDANLKASIEKSLIEMAGAKMLLPVKINGYTDFLTSKHHTERNGRLKGLAVPLPPSFFSLPVAYHGRTSSIRLSGSNVIRPRGQYRNAEGKVVYGPVGAMDYELEMAAYVRVGNEQGTPIPLSKAHESIFGYCLLNDWSAKDIQWWEQVLGPFLGKNFHSSLSPWIVTSEALAPFQTEAPELDPESPPLLPHLDAPYDRQFGGLAVDVEAWIGVRELGLDKPVRISQSKINNLSWTFAQMLTHHASNGCNMLPGDLFGSGTISGPTEESRACMTELAEAGRKPLQLADGVSRGWLEDGDEITLKAYARKEGFRTIGFGECRGKILPCGPVIS